MAKSGEIRVGDKLINNDPRDTIQAPVVVTEIDVAIDNNGDRMGIAYQSRTRRATVGYHRIFTDNKKRSGGYNLAPRG